MGQSLLMTNPPSKAKTPPVSLAKLLDESLIVYSDAKVSKNDAITDLVGRLSATKRIDTAACLAKVLEREKGPTTTLDTGLAIPHARVPGLKGVAAILGVYPSEVSDPAQPDLPIRLLFVFVSPDEPAFFPVNLQLLRKIAVVFQPALIEKLVQAKSPAQALELIRAKD